MRLSLNDLYEEYTPDVVNEAKPVKVREGFDVCGLYEL